MPLVRQLWLPITAMIIVIAGSNVAVKHPINDWLTFGALTYPISFLITDLTNRALGPARARNVVYAGFVFGVALSFALAGWRIALASGSAFLSAQLLDIFVFHRLRRLSWWRAPLVSSLSASGLDTAIFFSAAFAGSALPWVTWGLGDYGVKVLIAVLMLAPFRALMPVIVPSFGAESARGR